MFSVSAILLRHGNYQSRLKTRMVGYIPRFTPRKAKNCMIALRSESNTAFFEPHLKSDADRMDTTGRRISRVAFDPIVGRHTVFREAKIKGPFLTKSHIQKPAPLPWLKQ